MKKLRISAILATILSVCLPCFSQAVFVNAQLTDGSGSVANAGFLHFELDNCGNNFPTIRNPGASQNPWTIVRTAFDLKPNQPDGSINGQVLGNDVILCGGVASTYYKVTAMKDATTALAPVGGQPYVICTALASGMMPCSNPGTGLWNPALSQPAFQPIQPGFVQLFGNPVVSQVWTQPAGTTANLYGSFFLNGVPIGTGGGGGGVSNVSVSGSGLPPLFSAAFANPTSTPTLSFTLTAAPANSVFGNSSSSSGTPAYTSSPSLTSVTFASGSAAAPAVNFSGHTNSGLYYSTNAGVTFSSAGVDVFAANPSGGSPGPIGVPFTGGLSWYPTSGNTFSGGGQDTGISRVSPSILSIDAGVVGNSLGGLHLSSIVASNIGSSNLTVANLTITSGCTGCPGGALSTLTPATVSHTINNTTFAQAWQWALGASTNTNAFSVQEAVAASGSGNYLFDVHTLSTSTAKPIHFTAGGTANGIEMSTGGALSAIGSGSIAATTATTATNIAGGAASSLVMQTGVGTTGFVAYGIDGQCLVGTAGVWAPGSCAGGGAITGSSLANHQIAWATSSSAITSTANFSFDGTHTMQLPAGGVFGTPDTGTPKFTFSSNLITSNVQMAGTIFNASSGFQIGGAAASAHYLRGNGTSYVDNTIQVGDIPSLAGTYCTLAGCTMTGGFLFSPDGTVDIGALAATRPRDGNFTRHLVSADFTSTAVASPDTYTEQAAPGSSPSSGVLDSWADSTDHRFHDKNHSGVVGTTVVSSTAPSSNWVNGISPAGVLSTSQPGVADVTGAAPIDSPVFTTSVIGPNYGLNTAGTVSNAGSAGQGALYFTNYQNYGLAVALASNISWAVSNAQVVGGTVVFTLSTPVNGISWFPTDCFQVAGLPATNGLSSLNNIDLALSSKSAGTPTSTVTITLAGTANSCQTGTVGSALVASSNVVTATAEHYDQYLNGNTTIYNRLRSSSSNCPNYGSISLCSGGTTSSDQITGYDPTTTDSFSMLRRNPVSTTGSNWIQVGDSTHAAFTPGGLQTASISGTSGTAVLFNQGRIAFSGTAPTCAFTSGGGTSPSCTVDTGSTDSNGVIIMTTGTGSPTAGGTITLTFSATFGTNKPVCTYNASDAGAGSWATIVTLKDKTPSTASDLFGWQNGSGVGTALTASTAYWVNYHCDAK